MFINVLCFVWLSQLLCYTEILGVLLSVVSIWAVTTVLVLSAAQRIADGDYDINSQIMLITSGCAVGVNVLWVAWAHFLPYWLFCRLGETAVREQFWLYFIQDGAGPPSVRCLSRPQSRVFYRPAAEGRGTSETWSHSWARQRQREGGLHPCRGRSAAKCRGPAGRHHHPLLGQCRQNTQEIITSNKLHCYAIQITDFWGLFFYRFMS